jgi:hypothetical protein
LPTAAAGQPPAFLEEAVVFFQLPSPVLAVGLLVLVVGSAVCGLLVGRSRAHHQGLKESSGVLQGALLGFMGLSRRCGSPV